MLNMFKKIPLTEKSGAAKNKKYPWQIYAFWLANFVFGFELAGAILVPFFTQWGGLKQVQIQLLQSWFMFWIFILEIPTGMLGDLKGVKFSVLLGLILITLGNVVYILTPKFILFLIAEFILALGSAFVSGSKAAWLYDTTKDLEISNKYRHIQIVSRNAYLLGMLIASFGTGWFVHKFTLPQIFASQGITALISAFILMFIPKPKAKNKESFVPNYKTLLKHASTSLKHNKRLQMYAIFMVILASTSYFVIWLYQIALEQLGIQTTHFGYYRALLLLSEIILGYIFSLLIDHAKLSPKITGLILASLISAGFISIALLKNLAGIIILIILSGGIGLQIQTLYKKELNDEIKSTERATILSFISMLKRLVLTLANPIIGLTVDYFGVYTALLTLGIFSLGAIKFLPKER